MPRYNELTYYPKEEELYRIGVPTKVIYKAYMHWRVEGYIVCPGNCAMCKRSAPEVRYCIPAIIYYGKNWDKTMVKGWEVNGPQSKKIAAIYRSSPGNDLIVKYPRNGIIEILDGGLPLLLERVDQDGLLLSINDLIPQLPGWEGYIKPLPPSKAVQANKSRIDILMGDE